MTEICRPSQWLLVTLGRPFCVTQWLTTVDNARHGLPHRPTHLVPSLISWE